MKKTIEQLKKRIEINPRKLGGKPVIQGTRVSVEQILSMLSSGISHAEILLDFPHLEEEDIFAAIQYAATMVEDSHAYPRAYINRVTIDRTL